MSQSFLFRSLLVHTGSPITKLLLVKLADNANPQGICFPSYEYLANTCEVSVRTAKQHVKKLVELGFLTKTNRFSRIGRQRSNVYQLCLPELPASQAQLAKQFEKVAEGESDAPITNNKNNINLEGCSSESEVIRLMTTEGEVAIEQEFFILLKQSYPQVDVEKELNAMRVWLYLNDDKRKSADTIKFFVNTWLRRAEKAKQGRQQAKYPSSDCHSSRESAVEKARASYQQSGAKHPIESRIYELVQHKNQGGQ